MDVIAEGSVSIKKVVLENFLSFKRDEVNFYKVLSIDIPRLILIIGPNWSGKTSIYQAIKFVLGSNERDERYRKWSDFIRDGQDHTMVELHLEHNRSLIIIRRTVIKGKSPYYEIKLPLNEKFKKIPVIELQKLISSLNINPDNHFAFVSQGKIDALKNLKPVELCTFLEEGIGLKGLRNDILEQKLKLERLNLNFQALITKRNVLNKNLEIILPKLKRLEKKRNLVKRKEELNDELLWANRDKILQIIKKNENQVLNIENKIGKFEDEVENKSQIIKQIENSIDELDNEINLDSKDLGKLSYLESELLKKIEKWEKEKQSKKRELEGLEKELERFKKSNHQFSEEKDAVIRSISSYDNQISDIKKEIGTLIDEQSELNQKIITNESEFQEFEDLLLKEKKKKSKIKGIELEIKDFNSDANDIFQSLKEIEEKLNKNDWFLKNPSPELLREIDDNIDEKSEVLFIQESKLKKLEYQKSNEAKNLSLYEQSLKDRKTIMPANIIILREEFKKQGLKAKGPLIDYLNYEDRLSYAIESVLGEKMLFSFIASDWDTFVKLSQLKKKFKAFCNIYLAKPEPITPLPSITHPGIIGYLADLIEVNDNDMDVRKVLYSKIGNCLVIHTYKDAQGIYEKTNFKGRCVTLKGEQIRSYKYVFETPYIKKLKGFLSLATIKEQVNLTGNKIKDLNSEISILKSDMSQIDQLLKDLYNKKEIFSDLLYNFNQKNRFKIKRDQIIQKIFTLEKQKTHLTDILSNIQAQLERMDNLVDPDYKQAKKRVVKIPNILKKLNSRLLNVERDQNESKKQLDELNDKLMSLKNEQSKIDSLYNSKKDNFKKSDKKAFTIFKQLDEVKNKINLLNEHLDKKKGKKNECVIEKSEILEIINQLKVKIGSLKINSEKIKEKINSKTLELKRIEAEIDPSQIQRIHNLRPIDVIKNEIADIEKELLRYLDVDESLLQEKEDILTSLNELAKNKEDLEKDINSAINLEKKMEDTYYSRFNSELDNLESKINEKFSSSGIKTYCSLNLKGSFEELGIEIKAAVSKDQLKSCNALSGGQISMVSICLILSLQEIRPSPLCMFDEAAMFLDEKNAEISYQMIKATLEDSNTQLIMFLPTSSKSLFELADKIIGVARVGEDDVSTIFNPKIIFKGA